MFSPQTIQALSCAELAQNLDQFVYTTLSNHFGEKEEKQAYVRKEPRSPEIAELRRRKKDLKKARKLLHKNGQQGSEADKLISKQWFETMREHNRLTRAYREREALIKNSQQQKKFKKNPMKFGKELFQKKTVGEPSFSSQVALDYFAGG